MDLVDLQEAYGNFYAPRFEVVVDGESFVESDGVISGLRVETAIDRSNRFSFTVSDVFDLESASFTKRSKAFSEGATVDVKMGYGDATKLVLRGKIDSARPSFPADGGPSMSISGYDLLRGMQQGTGKGNWTETTLQAVVEDVVGDVGFAGTEVEGSDVEFATIGHSEKSDYRFLSDLAADYGFELFSRGGVFTFREPKPDASPAVTLRYGRGLRSFTPTEGGGGSSDVGTVKVRHWDEKKKEAIVGTAEVPGGGEKTTVVKTPVRSQTEAEQRAKAEAQRLASKGGSRGETLGIPEIQPGTVVELQGLGDAYSKGYYVESTTHQVSSNGYTTSFDVTEPTE